MRLLRIALVAIALASFGIPALAEDRATTDPEKMKVTEALGKDGYSMVNNIQVDDDKFTADAKSKDGKNVKVTLDMSSLKVLKVDPLTP